MKLYVIRHGQTKQNKKDVINGINNNRLTLKGIKQAKQAGQRLRQKQIDLIICSPLKRTKQTLRILNLKNIPVIYNKALVERNSNSKMNTPIKNLDKNIWYDITKDIVYKDSEGFKSIIERTKQLLNNLKQEYKNQNILLVTHGDVSRAINAIQNNLTDPKEISSYDPDNCEIQIFNI